MNPLTTRQLIYLGEEEPRGSYILRIDVEERLSIAFGGFKKGKTVDVEPGEYLYVGSAMGMHGSTCLAKRLLRHATRSEHRTPQTIRVCMLSEFPRVSLAEANLRPPTQKKLKWHVDYLLNSESSSLASVYVIRCGIKLEAKIGDMLEADPATVVFEKGLGASDRPGSTHLLRVETDEAWWLGLKTRLASLLKFPEVPNNA